jgi:drug/metabolite transporter (DMT)-like permease
MDTSHHNEPTSSWKGYAALVSTQIAGAVNVVGAKYLIATIPVLFVLSARFAVAAVLSFLFCFIALGVSRVLTEIKKLSLRAWILIIIQAVSAGAACNLLMLYGMRHTTAAVVGITTSALPAMTIIAGALIFREKMQARSWWCILLATCGILIVNAPAFFSKSPDNTSLLSSLLVILSLVPDAAYYIIARRYPIDIDTNLLSALANTVNMLIFIPLGISSFHNVATSFTLIDGIFILIIGISSSLFYVFWTYGCRKVSMSVASLTIAVMPVATLFLAALILGETIDSYQIIGVSLVVFSIVFGAQQHPFMYADKFKRVLAKFKIGAEK